MDLDNQRRSSNIEDRRGMRGPRGGGGRGGLPVRSGGIGIVGLIIIGLIMLFFPQAGSLLGPMVQGGGVPLPGGGGAAAPEAGRMGCQEGDQTCDFVAAVLGSTEDVWTPIFQQGALPNYGRSPGQYAAPTLVLFDQSAVETGGCGTVPEGAGPFYCPGDQKLYINPNFWQVMAQRLNSPGDFAQAYVVAHEVGHHMQNMLGATRFREEAMMRGGERAGNQASVRMELQADCFAGVWAFHANRGGQLEQGDLDEAINAAHNIGDDTLQQQGQGYTRPETYTHGTSDQRRRWFQRGYQAGDARQCDTFAVQNFNQL
jgi:predicted metalloprotease